MGIVMVGIHVGLAPVNYCQFSISSLFALAKKQQLEEPRIVDKVVGYKTLMGPRHSVVHIPANQRVWVLCYL